MLFATLSGFGTVCQNTIANTVVQTEADPHMRGRSISIFLMAMFGMLPLGSLLIGGISQWVGAPLALLAQGIGGLILTLVFSTLLLKRKSDKNQSMDVNESDPLKEENVLL